MPEAKIARFYKLYKDKPAELFYIFNRIYKMKKSDKEYGYNLFCQISNFLDKKSISDVIKQKYKVLCINDSSEDVEFEKTKKELISIFEGIFKEKSSFEK